MFASNLTIANLSLLNHLILLVFMLLADATLFIKSEISAQELTLFETIETPSGGEERGRSARNRAGDIESEPLFTLVGIARFADHYSALINNGNERNIRLDDISRSITFIPGYPAYKVLDVSSQELSIRYPVERDCLSNEEQGISCSEDNVATLRLPNAPPIKSVAPDFNQGGSGAGLQLGQVNTEQNAERNPFATLLEEATNSDSSSGETSSFTPRRIRPEDVPSGMRVVSTPFGDRLVEE